MIEKSIVKSLVVLLAIIVLLLAPFSVYAQTEVESDLSSSMSANYHAWQTKAFYEHSRYWAFYANSSDLVYKYSDDDEGDVWTVGNTSLGITLYADNSGAFDLEFDGTYVHLAYVKSGSTALQYRRFNPNANGTVTWSQAEQSVGVNAGQWAVGIGVDSSGYPFIGYGGTDNKPYVTASSANDGTWSTDSGFPKALTNDQATSSWYVDVVNCSGRDMLAVYGGVNSRRDIRVRAWDFSETDWLDEVIHDDDSIMGTRSFVAESKDVHISYMRASTNDFYYDLYDWSEEAFVGEELIRDGVSCSNYQGTQLIFDDVNNDLYYLYPNEPISGNIYVVVDEGSGFSSSQILVDAGDGLTANMYYVGSSKIGTGELMGLFYSSDDPADNIQFKLLFGDEAGMPVGLTLSASNVDDNSATLRGEVQWDGSNTTDAWFVYSGYDVSEGIYYYSNDTVPVDDVETDDIVETTVYNLPSNTLISYYMVLENYYGQHIANSVTFTTDEATVSSIPVCQTDYAENFGYSSTYGYWVGFHGIAIYDGGLDCVGGVQYRIKGSSEWSSYEPFRETYDYPENGDDPYTILTGMYYRGYITHMEGGQLYEWRSTLRNTLGTAYGETEEFIVSGVPGGGQDDDLGGQEGVVDAGGSIVAWLEGVGIPTEYALIVFSLAIIMIATLVLGGFRLEPKLIGIIDFVLLIVFVVLGWIPGWIMIIAGTGVAFVIFSKILQHRSA